MFRWLQGLFQRRGVAPPPPEQVFPDVDVERIAADLRLEVEGVRQGGKEQPGSDEARLDQIEQKIVDTVGQYRRLGIERFGEHEQVYDDRAGPDWMPGIRIAIGDAKTDFMGEVVKWKDALANEVHDLKLVGEEFKDFCTKNRLQRTIHEGSGLHWWVITSLVILIVESLLNGVFFAKAHKLGLLGGVATALGISVINIGVAASVAWISRNFNHRLLLRKLVGGVTFLCGVAFASVFNLWVAHFRNAAEAGKPWAEAAGHAIDNIWSDPLGLESIDSWLLGLLGMLMAGLAGWKTYAAGDPYPGYGRVWRKLHEARQDYADSKEEVINTLIETRDRAVDKFNDAYSEIQRQVSGNTTAQRELNALRAQRDEFLRQCGQKANLLLAVYRNANQEKRTTPPPQHFSQDFQFPPPPDDDLPLPSMDEEAIRKLKGDINQAIVTIHEACAKAIESFPTSEDIVSALGRIPSEGAAAAEGGAGAAGDEDGGAGAAGDEDGGAGAAGDEDGGAEAAGDEDGART